MSDFRLSRLGTRRLDLGKGGVGGGGAGGGRGMEYLLVAALGVIIVGSLGVTLWSVFGSSRSPANQGVLHFKCIKCGYQFTVPLSKINKMQKQDFLPEMGVVRMNCPKCGGHNTAELEVQCPKCKRWYISKVAQAQYIAMTQPSASGQMPQVQDVCPYCHTNRAQWYREHYKHERTK